METNRSLMLAVVTAGVLVAALASLLGVRTHAGSRAVAVRQPAPHVLARHAALSAPLRAATTTTVPAPALPVSAAPAAPQVTTTTTNPYSGSNALQGSAPTTTTLPAAVPVSVTPTTTVVPVLTPLYPIPSVVGDTVAQAEQVLGAWTVDAGAAGQSGGSIVTGTYPAAGTMTPHGALVTLTYG